MNNSILTRVNNDVNGNPRYVAHYMTLHDDYATAKQLAKLLGGKAYRNKSYGGGFVFQSYDSNLGIGIVCLSHVYASIDMDYMKEHPLYNPKKSTGVNLEKIIKAEKQSFLIDGRLNALVCEDWLKGLPALVNTEYWNDEIIKLLEYRGIECNPSRQERIVELFWESCGDALFKLCGSKL